MWFISEDKQVVIQADVKEGLYFVLRIMPHSQGIREIATLNTARNRIASINIALLAILDRRTPSKPAIDFPSPAREIDRTASASAKQEELEISEYDHNLEPCYHMALTAEKTAQQEETEALKGAGDSYAIKKLSRRERTNYYNLMYRRFSHIGPDQFRNLHKVTKLKRPIVVLIEREICRVCKLTKLRNRTNKKLSFWKESILALVFIDIAGPFLLFVRGNIWFCQVIDNLTRRIWTLLGKTKSEIMLKLEKWKKEQERAINLKVIVVRLDNAIEIREKLDQWSKEDVRKELIVAYEGSY